MKNKQRGVTLIEVMIATSILAIVVMGAQILFLQSIQLGDLSQEVNMATFDINTVIGHVRQQSLPSLLDPAYQDSEGGAHVPHGGVVDKTLYCYGDSGTTTHLTSEEIIVYYMGDDGTTLPLPTDKNDPLNTNNLPADFVTPDPLQFTVECTWTATDGESHSLSISGIRTR